MTDEKNLGSIRRETREAIGLSRKYLANIADVSEATIMHFERGGRMQYETKSKLLRGYKIASLPSDILGKTEVTVDGATKHVECTTVGYSAECVGIDHVIYKKKIKRVTTEVIEVEITADEFAKMMKGETA